MSKCGLSVEIDQAGRRFTFGDKVAGHVTVHVEDDCRCNRLKAALAWKAHGHDRASYGPRIERVLFEGEWKADERRRYSFEFEVPNGPLPYHGQEFSVDWLVAADADIASAADMHAEAILTVALGDDPARVPLPEVRTHIQSARFAVVKEIAKTAVGVVGGSIGWIVLVSAILAIRAGQSAGWLGAVAGGCFALAGTPLAISGARWLIGASFLKVAHIALDPPVCRPGEEIRLSLTLMARRAVTIDGVTITLEGKESVFVPSGKTSHEYAHTFAREDRLLPCPPRAMPGLPISIDGRLTIPGNAPHSFQHSTFQPRLFWEVAWKVHVRVALRGRPDWTRELAFRVSP